MIEKNKKGFSDPNFLLAAGLSAVVASFLAVGLRRWLDVSVLVTVLSGVFAWFACFISIWTVTFFRGNSTRDLFEETGPESCRTDGCDRLTVSHSVMCKKHHLEMLKKSRTQGTP